MLKSVLWVPISPEVSSCQGCSVKWPINIWSLRFQDEEAGCGQGEPYG